MSCRNAAAALVESNAFMVVVVATIAVNAVVLRQRHPGRGVHRPERSDRDLLNSMEEARELERRQAIRDRYGARGGVRGPIDPEAHAHVVERIAILRSALDELEVELALDGAPRELGGT